MPDGYDPSPLEAATCNQDSNRPLDASSRRQLTRHEGWQ